MNNDLKEQFVTRLGFNAPEARDLVNRDDYRTEKEYLSALAATAENLEKPEVKRAMRLANRERMELDEDAEKERQRQEYRQFRSNVKLSEFDEKEVLRAATSRAHDDLAKGAILPRELGERVA